MKYKTAKDIMTSPVLTVSEDWTLEQVAGFFVDHGVTGAPVTSRAGQVIGVVSTTDIVRHDSLPLREDENHDTHEYYLSSIGRQYAAEEISGFRIEGEHQPTVRDLMTPMLFHVEQDTPVQEVADMMMKGNIHRVLVTENGRLLGLVAAMDMLKIVREL